MTAAPTAAPTRAIPRPPRYWTEPDRLAVDDVELALRRHGSGPPVLYLHGHWLTRRWLPFHARLAESVDLIAPEHPGFGDTAAPPWLRGRPDLVLFYRRALDALELPRVHVVGYGLGGWLAADLAVWCPDRVASLSVIAPFGLRVPGEPVADVFLLDPATYDEVYFGGAPGGGGDHSDLVPGVGTPAQGGVEEWAQRYHELGTAASLIWGRRYDLALEHRLPRLGVPALVVDAEQDRVVPPAHAQRWAELLGARRVRVPGAGHALVVQEPDRTATAVAQFVTEAQA